MDISRTAFSPDGDGSADEALITVQSDQAAEGQVEIVDGADRAVRAWPVALEPGVPVEIVWDGRDGGQMVPDGGYRVVATARVAPAVEGRAERTVIVDVSDPRVRLLAARPSVVSSQRTMRFHFRVHDRAPQLGLVLTVTDRLGDHVGRVASSASPGDGSVAWAPRRPNGALLYPGLYVATLAAEDDAGNVTGSRRLPWRVHRPMRARVIRRVFGSGPRVAVTIDDCHHAAAWRRMVTALARRQATATFFCPGRQILANPSLVRRTLAKGNSIGAHGWDHALLTSLSREAIERRLRNDAAALWRVARDTTVPYFRPTYGGFSRTVVAAAGSTSHPLVVLWDVDPRDWTSPGPSAIASTVVRNARPGSIVVLHTLPTTAAALPAVIGGLRKKGLEPVGLPELLRAGRG